MAKSPSKLKQIGIGFLAFLATVGSSIGVTINRLTNSSTPATTAQVSQNPYISLPIDNILSNLSSLASLLSLYYSYRAEKRAISEDARRKAIEEGQKTGSTGESVSTNAFFRHVIDSKTFQIIKNNINKQFDILNSTLADTDKSLEEKDKIAQESQEFLCKHLNWLKKYNNGNLPQDENLQRIWLMFGCK